MPDAGEHRGTRVTVANRQKFVDHTIQCRLGCQIQVQQTCALSVIHFDAAGSLWLIACLRAQQEPVIVMRLDLHGTGRHYGCFVSMRCHTGELPTGKSPHNQCT